MIAGKSFQLLNTKKQLLKAGFQNKNIGVNGYEIAKDTSLTQRWRQAKLHMPLEMPIWSEIYFDFKTGKTAGFPSQIDIDHRKLHH